MSAYIPEGAVADDKELRAELVSRFNLDTAVIARIFETMQTADVSFVEAAVRLGIVTPDDITEAAVRSRPAASSADPGLFETAIRKISSDRRLVVRHGDRVTPGPRLILAHDAENARSERLRALRTELLLRNDSGRGANLLAVLSPSAGEGRSQLAAELAIAFAQLGRRTLLIDADMRKPQQHAYFGATNEHGLSRVVAHGERPMYQPVVGLQQMHLLTAGPVPSNPLELLSDGRFERLMAEWRNTYEFVVLDTPPVTQCADSVAIATLAGRVLVLSRAQHTSYRDTREMMRRLTTTHSKILGAVLNHF